MRNTTVECLESPGKVLENNLVSILPKSGMVLAFELPQKRVQPPHHFKKYPKDKYEVFIILDGMEVPGEIHVPGTLDLLHVLTDAGESFLPLSQATVAIETNPTFLLRQTEVLVYARHMRLSARWS